MEVKRALIFVAACASAPGPAPVAPSPAPTPTVVEPAPAPAVAAEPAPNEGEPAEHASEQPGAGARRPDGDGKPQVNLGHVTVDTGIGEVIVRRVITSAMARLKYCYEKELQRNPSLEGMVDVAFAIATNGTPHDANVSGVAPDLSSCVQRSFEAMHFPPPKSDAHVKLLLRYSTR